MLHPKISFMIIDSNNTIEELLKISCVDFLISRGYEPTTRTGAYTFFLSPFRNEKTPSFYVKNSTNRWVDNGIAAEGYKYGNVIDLMCKLDNLTFSELIKSKRDTFLKFEKFNPEVYIENVSPIQIIEVSEVIHSRLLLYYLESRKINYDLVKDYLCQVTFILYEIKRNAIGFKNDKGGYEFRSKSMKIGNSPKWYTTIEGNEDYLIFEGFMDFLSYVTIKGKKPKETVIVMNSVSFAEKLIFNGNGYKHYYGDNDRAGNDTLLKMPTGTIDKRDFFKGFKDVNEYLCNKQD